MTGYAVVFEKTETGWSAYAPDLPGLRCGWARPSRRPNSSMREGIEFHIEGLRADGEPVPEPTTRVSEIVPA